MTPFNKPYITGKEVHYIYDAVSSGHLSGNGKYTKLCQNYFVRSLLDKESWCFQCTWSLLLATNQRQNRCSSLNDAQMDATTAATSLAGIKAAAISRCIV